MNDNRYELYDKATADMDHGNQCSGVTEPWRSQMAAAAEFAHEKAMHTEYTDVDSGKRIGTPNKGLTEGKDHPVGIRLLRVAVLAVCYFVLEFVAKTVTVAQFIFVAWQKRPHPGMQRLGTMIAEYMHAMWRYCTFASDDAPWPFRPWPR